MSKRPSLNPSNEATYEGNGYIGITQVHSAGRFDKRLIGTPRRAVKMSCCQDVKSRRLVMVTRYTSEDLKVVREMLEMKETFSATICIITMEQIVE